MRTRWLATCLGATAIVSGCSSSSSDVAPNSPGAPHLIRAVSLPAYSCVATSHGGPITLATGDVKQIRLCPLQTATGRGPADTLGPGDPSFARLLDALTTPDGHSRPGTACPEYADVTQNVIARTASGPALLHIPVDGCGHYLSGPLSILTAARRGPGPATAPGAGPAQSAVHPSTAVVPVMFRPLPSAKRYPLSESDPPGRPLMSRDEVLARYDRVGTPATLKEVTYGKAHRRWPGLAAATPYLIDYSREVWVMTKHYDPPLVIRDGGWGPPQLAGNHQSPDPKLSAETSVFDALTGTQSDYCDCDALPLD